MMVSNKVRSSKAYRTAVETGIGRRAKTIKGDLRQRRGGTYSNFDEERIIARLVAAAKVTRYCVDIAAGDGQTSSNTYPLFRQGWAGLSAEMDGRQFRLLADVHSRFPASQLFRGFVTPTNVLSVLAAADVPKTFGFLNLDIDGYDYHVLDKLLTEYRPSLICTEINQSVPPPLRFTVNFDPAFIWDGSFFFGQSVGQLDELCQQHDYRFVNVEYNNAFIMPREIAQDPISAAEAYRTGYYERADRLVVLPSDAAMEPLHHLSPSAAVDFLNEAFVRYRGRYTLDAGSSTPSN